MQFGFIQILQILFCMVGIVLINVEVSCLRSQYSVVCISAWAIVSYAIVCDGFLSHNDVIEPAAFQVLAKVLDHCATRALQDSANKLNLTTFFRIIPIVLLVMKTHCNAIIIII